MKYGPFETVKELHRGPRASVHVCRREGSADERFAIKVVEPNVSIIGREAAQQRCEAFLDTMRVQEIAAAGASNHWVKVHDRDMVESAAYAVMDRFHSSAEEIIKFRRDVDASDLYQIIRGVVAGLIELEGKYKDKLGPSLDVAEAGSLGEQAGSGGSDIANGRCHGNLKPSNVLLSEDSSRVALTDPASDEQVKQERMTVEDDLRAVGCLIYSLVTHQEWRSGFGAKVEFDEPWRKIGRDAKRWHALCRSLLTGQSATAEEGIGSVATLEDLHAAVQTLKPIAQTTVRPWIKKAAAAAAVMILAATAVIYVVARPEAKQDTQTAGIQSPEPEPLDPTPDPVPIPPVEEPTPVTPVERVDDPPPAPSPALPAVIQTWLAVLDRDEAVIANVPSLAALAEQGDQVGAEQLRQSLRAVVEAAYTARARLVAADRSNVLFAGLPAPAGDVMVALARGDDETVLENLRRAADVLAFDAQVADAWAAHQRHLARITDTNDDFLNRFPGLVDEQLRTATDLDTLADRIAENSDLSEKIAAALQRWDSDIDKPHLARQFAEQPALAQTYRDWVEAVSGTDYALLPASQVPRLDDPQPTFDDLQQRLVSACMQPLPEEFERGQGQLLALMSEIETIQWDGTRDRQSLIVQRHDQLNQQMQAFSQHWEGRIDECVDCENWWQETAAKAPVALEPLVQRWDGAIAQIAQSDCRDRSKQVEVLSQSLQAIEAGLALVDAAPEEARDVFEQKRNEFAAQESPAVEVFQAWQATAIAITSDFSDISNQLNRLAGYDEVRETYQTWQDDPVLDDLEKVVGDTRSRVEALRDLPDEPHRLAAIAAEAEYPELRVAAWRVLREFDQRGESLAEAIAREREAWWHVQQIIGDTVPGELEAYAEQRRDRWRARALDVRTAQDMESVLDSWPDYDYALNDLPFELRFNDLVRRFNSAARANTLDAVFDLADEMLEELDDLVQQSPDPDHARIGELRGRLHQIADMRDYEGLDPNTVGPGTIGWRGEIIEDEDGQRHLRYRPPADLDHPPLIFRRVDLEDRAVYLCTTEVSLSLFKYAFEQSDQPIQQWSSGSFRGAHGWQLNDGQIDLRDRWLRGLPRDADFDCVGALVAPTLDHPAHQVTIGSAMYVAMRLGTRLPSLDEWRSAYNETRGAASGSHPANLRGAEWEVPLKSQVQRTRGHLVWWEEHAATAENQYTRLQRNNWLIQADYVPENPFDHLFIEEATNHLYEFGENDGALWFRPVHGDSEGGDRSFRDLVGNVAEFVLREPWCISELPAGSRSSAGIRNANIEAYVIGASALSNPSVGPGEAQLFGNRHWHHGFPDVGFRLALELEPGQELTPSPRGLVDRLLSNPPYILAGDP